MRALWILILFSAVANGAGDGASRLYHRLAGVPLPLDDFRRSEVEGLVARGALREAARIATDRDSFYNVTLRHWASHLSDRNEDPLSPFNDFVAMVIGTVRDDRDFREILTGDFTYAGPAKVGATTLSPAEGGNPVHYQQLETLNLNFRRELKRVEPQSPHVAEAAGVLTSNAWGLAHLTAGTNRRPVEFAFRQFLCVMMDDLKDAATPDYRVRRDVDRRPGGAAETYLGTCRACHGGLDALSGAFAHYYYGFANGAFGIQVVRHNPRKVHRKMNQNGDVYPEGHITVDDSWINLWTENANASLEWRGPGSGRGVRELGSLLANAGAFSRCLARRTFSQVCRRDPGPGDNLNDIVRDFESNGYRLRRLFESVAAYPGCVL